MLKVIVGNNTDRWPVIVEPATTLRSVLEDQGIDYSDGTLHLDGSTLRPGDLDKTFEELGITTQCFLLRVKKVDNA